MIYYFVYIYLPQIKVQGLSHASHKGKHNNLTIITPCLLFFSILTYKRLMEYKIHLCMLYVYFLVSIQDLCLLLIIFKILSQKKNSLSPYY